MAGVAQQGDIAFAPTRLRIAVEQRPFVNRRAGGQHLANLRVETIEGFA
jgi:hypothetical protein